ncbi:RNA exonuclease 3 [Cytospora mali]|uniref:RNA exonuclease 3 n=1 Tax=Cytospora mali TaxID=578113 RepID=A0A194VFM6_CYTMA|nr:RNA exonuclease 3 [Valsa mali var. pyri (nom. inval.)]
MTGPAGGPTSAVPLFNGLKHLPCPKEAGGGRCTTVACLFGHREEALNSSLDGADDGPQANDRPPKRQRIDNRKPDGQDRQGDSPRDAGGLPQHSLQSSIPWNDIPQGDVAHVDSLRVDYPTVDVSSAAGRKRPREGQQPSGATVNRTPPTVDSTKPTPTRPLGTTKCISSPVGHATLVPASTGAKDDKSKPPSIKPRKPEALNPRHLQKAPAAHGIRLQLLKLLHAQFERLNEETSKKSSKDPNIKKLGLVLSGQELIWMALDREQHLAVHKSAIYSNLLKQDVVRYRKLSVDDWIKERTKATATVQPEKKPADGAAVVINTGLTPDQEVQVLKQRLVTPIDGLAAYGYVPSPPSDDQIIAAKAAVEMSKNWEKCDRCTARFQVFPGRNLETGELASGGKCTHHPGRQYLPDRQKGDTSYVPKRYRCCGQDAGESPGCVKGNHHVWKTSDPKRLATLWNYAAAPANDNPSVAKAVCFDCEMGYTVYGMELIRLTATSWPDGAGLIDVLVQPFGEILDLNSQYSGVWPEDLARGVSWTKGWKAPEQKPGERKILQKVSSPEVARDLFFSLISPDTILIGHGLENDLNAMRMVHPKLVDTILLYPHKRGLPIRNSLRILMEVHLNRRIQIETGEGHDSAEDARAAGDLARLKVQKEWSSMKSDGWSFVDGTLREPGWKPASQGGRINEELVGAAKGGALLTEEFLEAP